MNGSCEKTMGKNIFKENKEMLIQYNPKWNLLRCVIAVAVKICGEQKKGFGQVYKGYKNAKCLKPMLVYCNSHQKVFC